MEISTSRPVPQLAIDTCGRRLRHLGDLADVMVPAPDISWYGPAGVAADRPGSEATVQALCGIMQANGRDRGVPRRLGLEAASVAAGLLGAQGAIAAAIAGLRHGTTPPATQTSVVQAGLLLLSHYFVVATGLGDAVPGPPLPAPGPPFRSADGHWFEIETLDAEPWSDFWTLLGAAGADLGRGWTVFRWRYERATCSLPVGLHEATARFTLAELRRLAARADVSLTPLRTYADVVVDPGAGPAHPRVRPHETGPRPGPADAGLRPVSADAGLRPVSADAGRAGEPAPGPPAVALPLAGIALPLAGIRVIEATSRIQGPFAGMLLRMLGADVLRIQPPEGDYGRAARCLHRRKAALRLDLGTPAGRAELAGLVAGADVFLHNWRPGKAAEWGLEFHDLAAGHPGLVYANTSGWGDGPRAPRLVGTDFLVQAYAGMGDGANPDDEPPFPSRMVLCDLFGGLVGAEGVLTGLYRRERTGAAYEVRSSLLAGAMALQVHVVGDIVAGTEKGRGDGRPAWGVLDRPVATADGMLALSVDDDAGFARLCRVCGLDPEGASRAATEQLVLDRLGAGEGRRWEELLTAEGVAAAVVCRDLAAVPADPRLADLFEPVAIGGVAPRSPWTFG